jgi:IS5 family transposase
LLIKDGRYHHAKQFKRKRATLKKLTIRLGRVYRDLLRKADQKGIDLDLDARNLLDQCHRLLEQKRTSKDKLYSFHEPQTACIAKGKAHKRYEFGNKSTFITTAKECFIIHADAHEGNPYDGHTLSSALDRVNASMQTLAKKHLKFLFTDKGYRGHGYGGETTVLIETSANKKKHKHLKRRSSIEPVISHAKAHHRMGRNFLKGHHGDLANTLLAACGYNLKKIYNTFKKAYKKMLSWLFFMLFIEENRQERVSAMSLQGIPSIQHI